MKFAIEVPGQIEILAPDKVRPDLPVAVRSVPPAPYYGDSPEPVRLVQPDHWRLLIRGEDFGRVTAVRISGHHVFTDGDMPEDFVCETTTLEGVLEIQSRDGEMPLSWLGAR